MALHEKNVIGEMASSVPSMHATSEELDYCQYPDHHYDKDSQIIVCALFLLPSNEYQCQPVLVPVLIPVSVKTNGIDALNAWTISVCRVNGLSLIEFRSRPLLSTEESEVSFVSPMPNHLTISSFPNNYGNNIRPLRLF